MSNLEGITLSLLVAAVSVAFAWLLWPLFGAIFWAAITAVLFTPVYRWLLNCLPQRRNLAAGLTVLIVVVIVILPLAFIAASLVQEVSGIYEAVQAKNFSLPEIFQQLINQLPEWAVRLMNRFGLGDLAGVQEQLSAGLVRTTQVIAPHMLKFGQVTFGFILSLFVMLYLLFFLLRDGDEIGRILENAIPLHREQQRAISSEFVMITRATIKGDLVTAAVQGALGGLIFWALGIGAPLLWGLAMAILSLLPPLGAAVIWLPVAIYLLATGSVWEGLVLMACGALVIGLMDNFLRPMLIGADTKMPEYVVLVSTLGGIELFGVTGIILGPVIAAMFLVAWDIFASTRRRGTGPAAG